MLKGWSAGVSEAVQRLHRAYLADAPQGSLGWRAAQGAGGLPVYCDIGGCLVLTSDGRVLEFSSYTGRVTEVSDKQWIGRALEAAAALYKELAVLRAQSAT